MESTNQPYLKLDICPGPGPQTNLDPRFSIRFNRKDQDRLSKRSGGF